MVNSLQGSVGFYVDGCRYNSVSNILSFDPKRKTSKKARGISHSNRSGDSAAAGRCRGTSIHKSFNQYLTTGEADVAPIHYPYWEQLMNVVSPLQIVPTWAEGPLLEKHSHFRSQSKSAIWSEKLQFIGCPDMIGTVGGVPAVVEIKTSTSLYTKNYNHKDFRTYKDWYPYWYAATQTAAYGIAWQECTKEKITTGIVINVTPTASQLFIIELPEYKKRQSDFRSLARSYNKHLETI